QSLALSLDFQYEMEWENDTAYVAILGNEDTTVFHWTDQNWQFHTECLPFITNSDSFRIQIGIIPDNTVEYRGIKIHNLAILNQSDNNASIGNFDSHVPDQYLLHQNYPNPFNPVTSITYELPLKSHVQLAIYDLTGKEVIKLVNEFKDSGKHGVKWNGSRISSGIYFYVLDTPSNKLVKKLVLIK
ncbi:MAG: T9SS type A sorting domain-containing protein, partial [Candidatus Marinimicrobia bacterium]|nr:T9SS type A sorting domain-containing protein [Candidatus Neomarinimicrobiota bacterium]